MNVIVIHPRDIAQPTGGGIQTFLRDFIRHSPADFRIVSAGLTNDERERPIGRWQEVQIGQRGTRFLPLATTRSALRRPLSSISSLRAAALLRRELTSGAPILQLHRPYRPSLFFAHRGPRVRFIHIDLDHAASASGRRRVAWLYRGFADDLARFDRVFVANERGALTLQAANSDISDRIGFLSGWYDESVFVAPASGERSPLRVDVASALGLPAESVEDRWIAFVGRLEDVKDPLLALEAFARLDDASAGVRLLVCGDGELRTEVRAQASKLGVSDRVHLLGDRPRNAVARLMAASDVLLLTSRAEGGGPRVVLEALGAGLPVVSTVVGEVRRAIVHGRSGWLAEDGTAASLGDGLRWALSQPRELLSAAAVQSARPFVAARVLAPVYDSYREMAAVAS